ncbi:tetratricopeptide repeat protein [Planctomycetota bacterium]
MASEEVYKQAIDLESDMAEAHSNLTKAYLEMGYKDSTLQAYEILKSLDVELAKELHDFMEQ